MNLNEFFTEFGSMSLPSHFGRVCQRWIEDIQIVFLGLRYIDISVQKFKFGVSNTFKKKVFTDGVKLDQDVDLCDQRNFRFRSLYVENVVSHCTMICVIPLEKYRFFSLIESGLLCCCCCFLCTFYLDNMKTGLKGSHVYFIAHPLRTTN